MAGLLCKTKLISLFSVCNKLITNSSVRTIVYPRRKPRHLPMAKTKVFRIIEHPYFPPDEVKLIEDLLAEYKRRIASLSKMFYKETEKTSDTSAFAAAEAEAADREHRRLLELNRLENERVRLIREETLEREYQENIMRLMQQQEEMEKLREEKTRMVKEAIEKAKAEISSLITHETLEQAIEHALDNPAYYNFCIDLNGQKYWEGESAETKDKLDENSKSVSL